MAETGRRQSPQRQMVLDALRVLDHPTAQEVLAEVRKHYAHISLGTVYRNLNLLSADGVVKGLDLSGSTERFELACGDHAHLRCDGCGKLFDINGAIFADMYERVAVATGFSVTDHEVFFRGLCPRCREGKQYKSV